MNGHEEQWEDKENLVDSPEYVPSSPVPQEDNTAWIEQGPIYEPTSSNCAFSAELNEQGSSLQDVWETYGHLYPSISDMVVAASKNEDIGIVLFPRKRSLSDDVWRLKEYLRSFGHSRTSVAMIRARFPLITDVQWTTLRQQPEFFLDGRSHTLSLNEQKKTTKRRRSPTRSLSRKNMRSDEPSERMLGIVRRLLTDRSSPASVSDIFKETELTRSVISRCLNMLTTRRVVTEFADGTNRTYGILEKL
jgi:hypothetical protein